MKLKMEAVTFALEGHRVYLERAAAGQVFVTVPRDGWRTTTLSDSEAVQEAIKILESVTGEFWGRCATNSEVRDLADLILKVSG